MLALELKISNKFCFKCKKSCSTLLEHLSNRHSIVTMFPNLYCTISMNIFLVLSVLNYSQILNFQKLLSGSPLEEKFPREWIDLSIKNLSL